MPRRGRRGRAGRRARRTHHHHRHRAGNRHRGVGHHRTGGVGGQRRRFGGMRFRRRARTTRSRGRASSPLSSKAVRVEQYIFGAFLLFVPGAAMTGVGFGEDILGLKIGGLCLLALSVVAIIGFIIRERKIKKRKEQTPEEAIEGDVVDSAEMTINSEPVVVDLGFLFDSDSEASETTTEPLDPSAPYADPAPSYGDVVVDVEDSHRRYALQPPRDMPSMPPPSYEQATSGGYEVK